MNWSVYNDSLVRRGEVLLDLGFLENWSRELEAMNKGKEGARFRYPESFMRTLAMIHAYLLPFRQLEGFTRTLNRLVPRLPSADYSGLRRRILGLDLSLYESLRHSEEPLVIAVDSSGLRVHKAGGWIERKHGKKRYVKIHLAVDMKTKQAFALLITTDDTHDSRAFLHILGRLKGMQRSLTQKPRLNKL